MIFKFRSDGLCSRLNQIWQIPYLHDKYNQKIDCIWNRNSECDIDFYDLFVPQDFFNIRSGNIDGEPPNFWGVFKDSEFTVGSNIPKPSCGIERFYLDILKPQPQIINEYKKLKIKYKITNQTLGFHIRGMEAFSTRKHLTEKDVSSTIGGVMGTIIKALKIDKNKKILIASDDKDIEKKFLNQYPNNCFSIPQKYPTHKANIQNLGRDKESITQAFVLLLLLSETEYKVTFGSNFSKFPDYLKNIRKVNDFLI